MHSSVKRCLTALSTTAAAGVLLFGAAPAASAVSATPSAVEATAEGVAAHDELVGLAGTCGANQGCWFTGTNHTGTQLPYLPGNGCRNMGRNDIRSGINNLGYAVEVWSGLNCTGTRVYMTSPNYGFIAQSVYACELCRSEN